MLSPEDLLLHASLKEKLKNIKKVFEGDAYTSFIAELQNNSKKEDLYLIKCLNNSSKRYKENPDLVSSFFLQESAFLYSIRKCPNVLQFISFAASLESKQLCLIMPFYKSLEQLIPEPGSGSCSTISTKSILIDIVTCLDYASRNFSVCHLNLSPKNIYYDKKLKKFILGGWTSIYNQGSNEANPFLYINQTVSNLTDSAVELKFQAPELLQVLRNSKNKEELCACDVFSLGLIMLSVLGLPHQMWAPLLEPNTSVETYKSTLEIIEQKLSQKGCSKNIQNKIIIEMLAKIPSQRIRYNMILKKLDEIEGVLPQCLVNRTTRKASDPLVVSAISDKSALGVTSFDFDFWCDQSKDSSLQSKPLLHIEAEDANYLGDWKDNQRHGRGKQLWTNGDLYIGYWSGNSRNGKGRMIFSNKDIYEGSWKDGKMQGYGKMRLNNGEYYDGEWLDDKKHGKGSFLFSNEEFYTGSFVDNFIHGAGELKFNNGDVYIGSFVKGKRHGHGELIYANQCLYNGDFQEDKITGHGKKIYASGEVYEGNWVDGKRHGKGQLIFVDGSKYEGDWEYDVIHGHGNYRRNTSTAFQGVFMLGCKQGYGKMTFENGDHYTGEWLNNLMHGQGEYHWSDGSYYIGTFVDGKKHGRGRMVFPEDQCYNGGWKEDKFHGEGEHTWVGKKKYTGSFVDGKREGFGVLEFFDGEKYAGQWVKGKENGKGEYTWKSGDRYIGDFLNGKRHGLGDMIYTDGTVYKGRWLNGKKSGIGVDIDTDGNQILVGYSQGVKTYSPNCNIM